MGNIAFFKEDDILRNNLLDIKNDMVKALNTGNLSSCSDLIDKYYDLVKGSIILDKISVSYHCYKIYRMIKIIQVRAGLEKISDFQMDLYVEQQFNEQHLNPDGGGPRTFLFH